MADTLSRIQRTLRYAGFSNVTRADGRAEALMVDGAKVELRAARGSKDGRWRINIHRHGILAEDGVDAYLICLEGVPGHESRPLYLIFEAPLERTNLKFSFSSLTRIYAKNIEDWDTLKRIAAKAQKVSKAA